MVSCEFCEIGLTSKCNRQMCANVSKKCICFVYIQIKLVVIEKKLIYCKYSSRFIATKTIITQILFIGLLIKFVWIIVLTSHVLREMFVLGIGSHLS